MPIIMGKDFEQVQEAIRVGAEDREELKTISSAPAPVPPVLAKDAGVTDVRGEKKSPEPLDTPLVKG